MDPAVSAILQILAQINESLKAVLASSTGTFTLDAGASTTVTDSAVSATSYVSITARNPAAATLMAGASNVYVVPGSGSFTVATADAGNAAGTETFSYAVFASDL